MNTDGHVISTLKKDVSTEKTYCKNEDCNEISNSNQRKVYKKNKISSNLQLSSQQQFSNSANLFNRFCNRPLEHVRLTGVNSFNNTLRDILVKEKDVIGMYQQKNYIDSSHLVVHPAFQRSLQQNIIKKCITATSLDASQSVGGSYSKNKDKPKSQLCEYKKENSIMIKIPLTQNLLENFKFVLPPKSALEVYRNSEVKSQYLNTNHNIEVDKTKFRDTIITSNSKSMLAVFTETNIMPEKMLYLASHKKQLSVTSQNVNIVKPVCPELKLMQYDEQSFTSLSNAQQDSNTHTVNQVQAPQTERFEISNEFINSNINIENSLLISNSEATSHNFSNTFVNSSGFAASNSIKPKVFEASLQNIVNENQNVSGIISKKVNNINEGNELKISLNKLTRERKYSELNSFVQFEMDGSFSSDESLQESIIQILDRLETDIKNSQQDTARYFFTSNDDHCEDKLIDVENLSSEDELIDVENLSCDTDLTMERITKENKNTQDKSILATPTTEDKGCQTSLSNLEHHCKFKRRLEFDEDLNISKRSKVHYKYHSGEKVINELTNKIEDDINDKIMKESNNISKEFSKTNSSEYCMTLEERSNFVTPQGIVPKIVEGDTSGGVSDESLFDDENELNWSTETTDEMTDSSDQLVPFPRQEQTLLPFPKESEDLSDNSDSEETELLKIMEVIKKCKKY